MPAGYFCASHGWLKNVAFITPVSSATVGLHQRPHPAPAHRARADAADLDDHGRALARDELRHGARLAPVAREVREQVADCAQAEHRGRALGLGPVKPQGTREPRGSRVADQGRLELLGLQRASSGEGGRGHQGAIG